MLNGAGGPSNIRGVRTPCSAANSATNRPMAITTFAISSAAPGGGAGGSATGAKNARSWHRWA